MGYKIELIEKEQLEVKSWSGGTTTELAIYPRSALYSERNFEWRLSSAKVEAEESVFTSLPNINRKLMVIEGELILEHEGHHRCILKSFDQDSFSGNWVTKSYGRVTDFNLMTSVNCYGELEAIRLEKGGSEKIIFKNLEKEFSQSTYAIYCVSGKMKLSISSNEIFYLKEGDIILISSKKNFSNKDFVMNNEEFTESKLIIAYIKY